MSDGLDQPRLGLNEEPEEERREDVWEDPDAEPEAAPEPEAEPEPSRRPKRRPSPSRRSDDVPAEEDELAAPALARARGRATCRSPTATA